MSPTTPNSFLRWTLRGHNWTLADGGRTLAVIEPCWSDRHACLFLINKRKELAYDGMYSHRTGKLRIILRLWFSRAAVTDETPKPIGDEAPM